MTMFNGTNQTDYQRPPRPEKSLLEQHFTERNAIIFGISYVVVGLIAFVFLCYWCAGGLICILQFQMLLHRKRMENKEIFASKNHLVSRLNAIRYQPQQPYHLPDERETLKLEVETPQKEGDFSSIV